MSSNIIYIMNVYIIPIYMLYYIITIYHHITPINHTRMHLLFYSPYLLPPTDRPYSRTAILIKN